MPPRVPAEVHSLANRSKLSPEEIARRQSEEDSIRPRPLAPRRPSHLSKHARECWDRHAPELVRLGLLTALDGPAFEHACESYALARTALEELRPRKADGTPDRRQTGLTVTEVDRAHGRMLKKHPAVAVYLQASGDYRSWCAQFGLTPAGRMGLLRAGSPGQLPTGKDGAGDGDDLEDLLGY